MSGVDYIRFIHITYHYYILGGLVTSLHSSIACSIWRAGRACIIARSENVQNCWVGQGQAVQHLGIDIIGAHIRTIAQAIAIGVIRGRHVICCKHGAGARPYIVVQVVYQPYMRRKSFREGVKYSCPTDGAIGMLTMIAEAWVDVVVVDNAFTGI